MVIISPSILSCDFLNIENELRALEPCKNIWIHLDIMDSHFVPNLTFGGPVVKNLHKITKHPLDAHFMVTNPEFFLDDFKNYKIHNFTFHVEANPNPMDIITKGKKIYPSIGISIKPKTPVSQIPKEVLECIDLILIMSVEPGFGGQKFIEISLDKIKELDQLRKKNKYHYQIQIDGGITNQNAKQLIDLGVNNLVAGSYIFSGSPQGYPQMVESLR
ncbi:MAG: ribulose-phosphate 3-epimerase [Bdellovibrionales bacterium RIFOXYB1_FULL_37_110]|nr:MAG: ribulose-phosphate 3-epimerase [Bdellovibrionales bacterium RIFOXYA1_FULL_38_20]OFZ52250.1 MAG: ribulose-phosphate 3-epimerase [Bdellovibrionales bacterium RIFOXYC1_FULL_37_79]OFZ57237.1 MAG: ribulose-phosphate 3-epimerase [Bdellovibrionales bacterium RIFOXYB1_FULL_37_110]OFZ65239.1 MAG: ribulose-phosphate 3-epimerase [Bdellovibrionales bacterium RIFOXYD1_FULL_36_51]